MGYQVLLRSIPTNGYIATALAWPQCTVEAPTREEALEKMRTAIAELFSGGEIVEVEVPAPAPKIAATYEEIFGMFRDDPSFEEFVAEVNQYRVTRNQIPN